VREKIGFCPEYDVPPGGKYAPPSDRSCSNGIVGFGCWAQFWDLVRVKLNSALDNCIRWINYGELRY